jgi:hypothetical protein
MAAHTRVRAGLVLVEALRLISISVVLAQIGPVRGQDHLSRTTCTLVHARSTVMGVIQSIEDTDGLRCIDFIQHTNGTFGFKEFRRDPEDGGRWTLIADYSQPGWDTKDEAQRRAASVIAWFKRPTT